MIIIAVLPEREFILCGYNSSSTRQSLYCVASLSDAHKDSNVVFIISGIMSMLVFCLLVLSAYIFYAKRKSVKQRDLQMKANQYNEEMRMLSDKTPDVSYDDLALGVCLHRGRFGDVRNCLYISIHL